MLASFSAFVCCEICFSLSWPHLLSLYSLLGSLICVMISYQCNIAAIHYFFSSPDAIEPPLLHSILSFKVGDFLQNSAPVLALTSNYIMQTFLYFTFVILQIDLNDTWTKGALIWAFLLPSCSMLITFSKEMTFTVSILCASIPFLLTKCRVLRGIPYAFTVVRNGCRFGQDIFNNVGLPALLELEWNRMRVPSVLRLFWLIREANLVAQFIALHLAYYETSNIVNILEADVLYTIFKDTMTHGCDTILAVLGMTSLVSYISHYIGAFFQMLLLTDDEDDRSMGTVSAIIFFVLAEQSGLTVLEDEKRYIRLCRNFCLLFTAMLYFVHSMVNPVLMSLSASRNPSLFRHVRALSVSAMLIILPVTLLYILWSVFTLSTWLLAVSAFCIQVVIKTLFSVLTYVLFLADAYYSLFWDNLDDYVYYIKALGNTIEFVFGIILFLNGLWIYFFESGGAIRAIMMCIHAYINIWCEARNGWSAFMKRRHAVNRVASIPDATSKQLQEHDDVCAICFQVLTSAKITACKHFYHEVCLRKWLYVQDSCPLCHNPLYQTEEPPPADIAILDDMVANVVNQIDPADMPRHNVDIAEALQEERLAEMASRNEGLRHRVENAMDNRAFREENELSNNPNAFEEDPR